MLAMLLTVLSFARAEPLQSPDGPTLYPMVLAPSGVFSMGGDTGETIEKPQHEVTLTRDFYVGQTEVTQKLFLEVMGYEPVDYWGEACVGKTHSPDPDHPAYCISWYEALRFANALSQRDGLEQCYLIRKGKLYWPKGLDCSGYRLPTEAEWEYAAKSGYNHQFSGGDKAADVSWNWKNSSRVVHKVASKTHTEWGIYDMSGNVWEWVWDFYGDYGRDAQTDPYGPDYGDYRVRRGGSWFNGESEVRSASRLRRQPRSHFALIGFRLVRTAPKAPPPDLRRAFP